MSTITVGRTPITHIHYPKDLPQAKMAAMELRKYLNASLQVELEVAQGDPVDGAFYISSAQATPETRAAIGPFEKGKFDRCVVAGGNGRVFMIGENPVSTLYVVYDFLQRFLDIRFFAPGSQHEHIPKHSNLQLEDGLVFHSGSRLAIRDWVNRTNNPEVIAFAVKNRINTILGCGPWDPERGAHLCNAKNAEMVRSYGLKLRGPGHSWRLFVPDESLFATHPEYFPMTNGERKVNGRTACFSNQEVRRIFLENLRAYLRKNPYWDIFSFWSEDVEDSRYCGCPECAKMELSDWYISLANDAAKVVEQELPHAVFEIIAYAGTRIAPLQVKDLHRHGENMLVNICLGYTRDLYHPFEQKTYGSAEVFDMYQHWRRYLADAGFKGRIMLMDYYNLCVLPNQGPRGLSLMWPMEVIAEDIGFYLKEGIDGLGAFTGFDCLCWPSPLVLWSWLQLWHDPEKTVEGLKDDFYPKYFGETGTATRSYLDALENAMHERTSQENIEKIKGLAQLLDQISAPAGDDQLTERLKIIRIHHGYCVLVKEIYLAFIDDAPARWQALEKSFMTFFEEHRKDLEKHIAAYPPLWVHRWMDAHIKTGFHWLKMPKEQIVDMLR